MTSPNSDSLIKIAELKKPYGIKGWLWLFSHIDERETIFAMQPWWLKTATGFKPLTVTQWRKQGNGLVAQFEQIPDRNVAETMAGASIWTDKSNLAVNAADEYYWTDLVGLTVLNLQDDNLGRVDDLFETGAHSIMVIKSTDDSIDDEQRLIPWHKQTVIDVFLEQGNIVVDWEADY